MKAPGVSMVINAVANLIFTIFLFVGVWHFSWYGIYRPGGGGNS